MRKSLFLLPLALMLSGCDNAPWSWPSSQAQPAQSVGLDNPTDSVPSKPSTEISITPQSAPQAKTYTYQGSLLLPPDAYLMNNGTSSLDDNTNVCGVLSVDQPDAQKYCYTVSQLHGRLYDRDHVALDVWGVRGNWYLLLLNTPDTAPSLSSEAPSAQQELWVDKAKFGVYHPYADIMKQRLLYLGDWNYGSQPTWPLQAYSAPGGPPVEIKTAQLPAQRSSSPMARITAVAQSSKNELWFKLDLTNSLCEQNATQPIVPIISNIWFPAYRTENNLRVPNVWYYAKGC